MALFRRHDVSSISVRQSPAFVENVAGKRGAELFLAGKLTVRDLVSGEADELTLEELKHDRFVMKIYDAADPFHLDTRYIRTTKRRFICSPRQTCKQRNDGTRRG